MKPWLSKWLFHWGEGKASEEEGRQKNELNK
jgi:hypothetical protein